jgi:hypothetical protein
VEDCLDSLCQLGLAPLEHGFFEQSQVLVGFLIDVLYELGETGLDLAQIDPAEFGGLVDQVEQPRLGLLVQRLAPVPLHQLALQPPLQALQGFQPV